MVLQKLDEMKKSFRDKTEVAIILLESDNEEIEIRENHLLKLMKLPDWDSASLTRQKGGRRSMQEKELVGNISTNTQRRKIAEEDYLTRMKNLSLLHLRMVQDQAKYLAVKALVAGNQEQNPLPLYIRRKMKTQTCGQPKVFGGALEDHFEATGKFVPTVVTSCVSVLRKLGMKHQGIFRIGGSHVS
jgi:hypothetical protein